MSRLPLRFWWIGVSALLVCLGSVGPWAKVLFVTASGLDGDGWITLIAGLAALALVAVYVRSDRRPRPVWPLVLILCAGGVASAVGAYDWTEIEGVVDDTSQEDDPFDLSSAVTVGWGLVLVTIAGFSLCLSAIVALVRRRHEPSPPEPQPAPAEPSAGELSEGESK